MRRSIRAGTPKPTASIAGLAQLGDRSRRARRGARPASRSGSSARSSRSSRPARSTTPARIFVPPRSIPIARPAGHVGGYPTSPDGADDKPYRRLPGRSRSRARCRRYPRNGPFAARQAGEDRGGRRRAPGRAPADTAAARLEADRAPRAPRLIVVLTIVWGVAGFLSFQSGVSAANKRLAAPQRARRSDEEQRVPAQPRRRRSCCSGLDSLDRLGAQRRPPRRLDHARPHRPVPPPARLPLDPARPARLDPGGRQRRRSTPPTRTAAPRSRSRRRRLHRRRDQPRRHRRLQQLQGPDRRRGRDHDQRARADPLEPLRLPLPDAGALPASGRAGASTAASST